MMIGIFFNLFAFFLFGQRITAAITLPATGKSCPPGWTVSNNKCYLIDTSVQVYSACQTHCSSLGARMPCVENEAEQDFLIDRSMLTRIWTGLNRLSGSFAWDTGSTGSCPSTYLDWYPGQPSGGNEECVEMLMDGKFNDVPCSITKNCICEIEQVVNNEVCPVGWTVSPDGQSCYFFGKQKTTWDDCNSFCSTLGEGSDMLCVENAAQNEFIYQKHINAMVWVGYGRRTAGYKWNGECPSTYTNWYPGEPNGGINQNAHLINTWDGRWNDSPLTRSDTNCACQIRRSFNPTSRPTSMPFAFEDSVIYHTMSRSVPYKVSNGFAFAVVTGNHSMLSWGEAAPGGAASDSVQTQLASGVTSIVPSRAAYTALKTDGSVVPWGVPSHYAGPTPTGPVTNLVATDAAFAAIKADGAVAAFGSYYNGGNVVDNAKSNGLASYLTSGVQALIASSASFTALKADGTVYTWGNNFCGGGVSSLTVPELTGVVQVVATMDAFAARLQSGRVVTWGGMHTGGDSSAVAAQLLLGAVHLVATKGVIAAFKLDTSLVVWGHPFYGGQYSSAVAARLTAGVTFVAHTFKSMAALHADGSVTAWGDASAGGDASAVQAQLVNVDTIVGNGYAFAALTVDGAVVTWGDSDCGGQIPFSKLSALSSGVVSIYHTNRAFAALKVDGSVVVWGQAGHGGSPGPEVESLLTSGVHTICSNDAAFTAIKTDGSVVGWGHPVSIPTAGVLFTSTSLAQSATCA